MKKQVKTGSSTVIIIATLAALGVGIYFLSTFNWLGKLTNISSYTWDHQKYKHTETHDYKISDNAQINLDINAGSVTIKAWDKPIANLTMTKRTTRKEDLESLPVEIKQTTNSLAITGKWDSRRFENCSVDITLSVPNKIKSVNVSNNMGSIDMKNLNCDTQLNTNMGAIKVIHPDNATGSIDAHTDMGSIVITNAGGPVNAQTNMGSITISKNPKNPHTPRAKVNMGAVTIK